MFPTTFNTINTSFFNNMYKKTEASVRDLYTASSAYWQSKTKATSPWILAIQKKMPTPETMLSLCVGLLTLVTGVAFGFQPLIVFLSVASEYHGTLGQLVKWGIIMPSCFFQTMLWWNAYHSAAMSTLQEKFLGSEETQSNTTERYIKKIQQRTGVWIDASVYKNEIESVIRRCENNRNAKNKEPKSINTLKKKIEEIKHQKKSGKGKNQTSVSTNAKSTKDPKAILIKLMALELFHQENKAPNLLHNDPKKTETSKTSRVQNTVKSLLAGIPVIVNALNYLTINPFGVFFAFYTVMLTLTFPGVELASVVLPPAMMPVLLGLLALGYAAGFVCAFFLTAKSFRATFDQAVQTLEQKINSIFKLHNTEPELHGLTRHINTEMTKFQQANTDPTWAWLSSRPVLCAVLAFGCALSICIINYNAGIQAAIMMANVATLLTPGHLTSAHNIMNATMTQKAFGVYSALVTVGMTTGLLYNVATEAIPKEKAEHAREHHGKIFYWTSLGFSVAGQIFCNYVNTVKPHGILSALRMVKAPFEKMFQALFGIFGMGGMVIVTKLQAEPAQDIIEKNGLNKPTEKSGKTGNDLVSNFLKRVQEACPHMLGLNPMG